MSINFDDNLFICLLRYFNMDQKSIIVMQTETEAEKIQTNAKKLL